MITRVDARLLREAETYRLRFGCEACAHFDSDTERCASGYPNEAHKGIRLDLVQTLSFCKEFELA